jgi:hypothetical protein
MVSTMQYLACLVICMVVGVDMYGMGNEERSYWDNRLWVKKRNLIGDKRWGKRSIHEVGEKNSWVFLSKSSYNSICKGP